jgi:DNA-binding transcriptional LysR family regulator
MQAQPSGVLRASLPVDFAYVFLAPLIPEFARSYPGISFDFDLTPRLVDMVAEPFDVAIRMGEPPDSNLVARQLARLPRYLYASPRYLELAGEPTEPADLARHECLRMRPAKRDVWTLHNQDVSVDVTVGGRFLLNSVGMIQRLATMNMGVAVLARDIVTDDVANGR